MLKELRVRNYAVIDEVRLELGPGLNVLTGETGTGKSILVGALSLLVGERASADVIRAGEDRALVEGVFEVPPDPALRYRCDEAGIDLSEGWLILRRELQREGRNRAWVNGSPATAALVGELGGALVDLHGQHEHQALLRPGPQRRILDAYAGAGDLATGVRSGWESLREARRAADELSRRAAETRQRSDLLRHRADEIGSAKPTPGEEEALAAEIRRLEHSEDLLALSGELDEAIYGGEQALVDRLGSLGRALDGLLRIDPGAVTLRELYEGARVTLEELGRRLSEYHSAVEHDPARLERLRERQDLLYRLRRKYGGSIEDVIEEGRRARAELDALETSDADLRRLEREAESAARELDRRAAKLTRARSEAAARLEREVSRLLPDLGMPGGVFRVALEPREAAGPDGREDLAFLVSLNPGFEPGPLARVASGGEMSRVMLALKTVLARVDDVPSLVFDEIDAGIGGRVAHQVAERLAEVAGEHQVFAITHLPQIAARAVTHFLVEKGERDGRAATVVVPLDRDARVEEIARMLGGDPESEVSRRHAEELLAGRGG
ncbi:MAG: DNA repair protein RecN [Gemmatimonadota bacterium]